MIKSLLKNSCALRAAKNLYCALGGSVRRSESEWLEYSFGQRKDVFFVQIGAHDGKSDDAVYPFARALGWSGVLVEPVGYLFDRLIENYRGSAGISFERAAVADRDGRRSFYRLRETADALPGWYDQTGSLDLDIMRRHRSAIPNLEDYLLREEVECMSFDTLAARHRITRLDLLLIDAEGYDFTILKTIDLRRFRPALIIYEQMHLSSADRAAARALLKSHGYKVHPIGANDAAVRTRLWRHGRRRTARNIRSRPHRSGS